MSEVVVPDRKSRGRPRGTGIDDMRVLEMVADLIVADPRLKPTTAMKRSIKAIGPSHLRRLQVKWKCLSETLFIAAQRRRTQQPVEKFAKQLRPAPGKFSSVAADAANDIVRALEGSIGVEAINGPGTAASYTTMTERSQAGSVATAFAAAGVTGNGSATSELARRTGASLEQMLGDGTLSATQIASSIAGISPNLPAISAIAQSPWMTTLLQLQNSPAMELVRRQQELADLFDPLRRIRC